MNWNIFFLCLNVFAVVVHAGIIKDVVKSPDARMTCVFCNSRLPVDKDCATATDLSRYIRECEISDTSCFVEITKEGDTNRGCGVGSEDYREACSTANCNTPVFPVNRHKCHQCINDEDCYPEIVDDKYSAVCKKYAPGDRCYSISDGNQSRRGCTSDVDYPRYCSETDTCLECSEANCNTNAIDAGGIPPTSIICAVCDSAFQTSCVSGNLDAFYTECSSDVHECFTEITSNGTTRRGCGNGTEDNSGTCSSSKCNSEIYPSNRQQCNQCTNCDAPIIDEKYHKVCSKYVELDSCYSTYSDSLGPARRGCKSDIDYPKDCGNIFGYCESCAGHNCNVNEISKPPFPNMACIVCDSKISNQKNCASADNLGLYSQNCWDGASECYVQIDSDGNTQRGCGPSSAANSEMCKVENCNLQLFPRNRLFCHQCKDGDASSDVDCLDDLSSEKTYIDVCPLYQKDEECYSIYSELGDSRRGCSGDHGYPTNCTTDVNCKLCNSSFCNNNVIEPQHMLKCYVCDSKIHITCAAGKHLDEFSQDCADVTECFVQLDGSANTQRGCGSGTPEGIFINTCNTDHCNTKVLSEPPPTNGTCVVNVFNIHHVGVLNSYAKLH